MVAKSNKKTTQLTKKEAEDKNVIANEKSKDDNTIKNVSEKEGGQKDKRSNKKLLIILAGIVGVLFLCCSFFAIFLVVVNSLDQRTTVDGGTDMNDQFISSDNFDHTTYLGYEAMEVLIEDNVGFSDKVMSVYDLVRSMSEAETDMISAAQSSDPEGFFDAYSEYNRLGSEVMATYQAMSYYVDGQQADENGPSGNLFIKRAYAKERSSWWYYVPVFGSMLKAKHETIETSRSGLYNYLKNELDPIDRDTFLDEYDLASVEDLKNASDEKVEQLARDPELRGGIDWTQVATDAGKQAVIATVEACKIAPSRNPVNSVVIGSAFRVVSEKSNAVEDPLAEKRTTLVTPSLLVDELYPAVGDQEGKSWSEIPDKVKSDLYDSVISSIGDMGELTAVTQIDEGDPTSQIGLPEGLYDLLTATTYTVPILISDVQLNDGETTEILTVNAGFEFYSVDPQIAVNLGIETFQSTAELEVRSCSDIVSVSSQDQDQVAQCESKFNSCKSSPLVFEEGYSTCIGSNGGCWDIGRWEYVNADNCGINGNNELDYSNKYFSEDFDYFPEGNLRYCECVVDCREQFTTKVDCSNDLRSCCEAI